MHRRRFRLAVRLLARTNMSALRAHLRAAIIECCQVRRDTKEHQDACIRDCLEEPESDWQWYIDYFNGERDKWLRARGKLT